MIVTIKTSTCFVISVCWCCTIWESDSYYRPFYSIEINFGVGEEDVCVIENGILNRGVCFVIRVSLPFGRESSAVAELWVNTVKHRVHTRTATYSICASLCIVDGLSIPC